MLRTCLIACFIAVLNGLSAQTESLCNNGLDDDGDGYIDCYDPDCACFSAPECLGTPPAQIEGQLDWRSGQRVYPPRTIPLVANLNPQTDDIPEIIVVKSGINYPGSIARTIHFYRGDGANAANPDTLYIEGGIDSHTFWMTHPVVGDLDGDGIPELVVMTFEGNIQVYRNYTPGAPQAMALWVQTAAGGPGTTGAAIVTRRLRPQLADFDGDGISEIVAGNSIFKLDLSDPANPQLNRVLFGGSSLPRGKFHDGIVSSDVFTAVGVADMVSVADCNGDPDCGGLEVVAGPVIYAVDLDPNDGDGLQMKVVRNLEQMTSNINWGDGFTAVADVDLDGIPDAVVISRTESFFLEEWGLYIWNKTGLKRYLTFPTRTGNGMPCIANVYDDTQSGFAKDLPEILVEVEDRLTCFNLNAASLNPNQPWWWTQQITQSSATMAPTVFDFNGDGLSEIAFRDRDNLRIMYGGPAPFPPGVDAERNWWKTLAGVFIGDGYPVVADVDNDGQAEIALVGRDDKYTTASAGSDDRTFLRVYESATAPWVDCRKVWNQFNYSIVGINDDLSVPVLQQKHWLEFPGPGGGQYPFNNQFTQLPPVDGNFQHLYPVPDATIALDSTYCNQQNLHLILRVCNQGGATLQDSTPLQLYRSDPATTIAAPSGTPFFLPQKVKVGACMLWDVAMPFPADGPLWGSLNDDGSLPTPFNPATDLPAAWIQECDYLNNRFSLDITASGITPDLGSDTSLCAGAAQTLSPGAGFVAYLWQDGSTAAAFTATDPGKYWVQVRDICGNTLTDTLDIAAAPTPVDSRTIDLLPGQSVTLNGQVYTQPGTVIVTQPAPSGCDSVITYTLVAAGQPCDVKTPTGCMRYELLGIRLDSLGQRRYRLRFTNTCASPLQYAYIQLPNGIDALAPGGSLIYNAPGGNTYTVRNPNASPFHSVRFKSLDGALNDGKSDIFEYTLPQQSAPQYIHVAAKLADGSASEAHLNTFNCPVAPWDGAANRGSATVDEPGISLRPNPTDGLLTVNTGAWQDQSLRLQVLNAQGQLVMEQDYAPRGGPLSLQMPGGLAGGLYYLLVQSAGGTRKALRFVLE